MHGKETDNATARVRWKCKMRCHHPVYIPISDPCLSLHRRLCNRISPLSRVLCIISRLLLLPKFMHALRIARHLESQGKANKQILTFKILRRSLFIPQVDNAARTRIRDPGIHSLGSERELEAHQRKSSRQDASSSGWGARNHTSTRRFYSINRRRGNEERLADPRRFANLSCPVIWAR